MRLPAAILLVFGIGIGRGAAAQPSPESSRPRVEHVLADMSRAILAADGPAFLATIDQSDDRLATEMSHFAEDLAKRTPFEFSATILDAGAAFEADRATCRVEWRWRIALDHDGRPIPAPQAQERRAVFPPVVFVRAPDGRWLWSGEAWQTLQGDGFVIKHLPGDEAVARKVLEAFPVARRHVDAGFDIPATAPQTIKLYADMEHLKATVYLSMPDPYLGGWNEAGESIKFMRDYSNSVAGWTRAFAHEYGHVATWEMGPAARSFPWWLTEGVAELAAEEFDPGRSEYNQREMLRYARRIGVVPWDRIADYDTCEQRYKHLAYVQGHHFVGYLSSRFGRDARNRWLRALAAGRAMEDATVLAFGSSFQSLSDQWQHTLPAPAESPAPPGVTTGN